jgi:hypothetical protein
MTIIPYEKEGTLYKKKKNNNSSVELPLFSNSSQNIVFRCYSAIILTVLYQWIDEIFDEEIEIVGYNYESQSS